MATAHAEIDIRGSRAEILDVLADLGHYPEWSAVHKRASILEQDDRGRPRRATMAVAAGGLTDQQTLDYTWRADGLDWSLVRSRQQRRQVGRYTVTERPDGACHVQYELTIDPTIPVPALLVRRIMGKAVTSATAGLKKRVENR